MRSLQDKQEVFLSCIKQFPKVAVAFSGGVDSSLLLYLAHSELGDACVAITARSPLFPARELHEAESFCEAYGIKHLLVEHDILSVSDFTSNPLDRCYLCKRDMFLRMRDLSDKNGFPTLLEGSIVDDESDYRPGRKALLELQVISPLLTAGFTKEDVRTLSRELGLPSAEKQGFACLASRIPFGESITLDRLTRIDRAEQFLLDEGFHTVRVRLHGELARIETDEAGMAALSDPALRQRVSAAFSGLGFSFTTLDLMGYQTGSMNYLVKSSPTTTSMSPLNS
ncbi:MAG: ATP-dependent sacrificial sulfur transferase LarE [Coriobacteriia bacterium]|nr:ATP-dependent sacrificial sulfur transferase LarE [Coriobacteriia bacterium]